MKEWKTKGVLLPAGLTNFVGLPILPIPTLPKFKRRRRVMVFPWVDNDSLVLERFWSEDRRWAALALAILSALFSTAGFFSLPGSLFLRCLP